MSVPLLSPFYFGSVEHYRLLAHHPRVVIDLGEHYERQSYRNRTSIMGPNGRQELVAQISRRSGAKMPVGTVGLSYEERWPQEHVHAIRSAYGQTPWFIHFIDEVEAVVLMKYDRLVDLDLATMRLAMKWLGLRTEIVLSETYVDATEAHLDLRTALHPKRPLPTSIDPVGPYPQVFADRHGFISRLSILDLVCNCGRDSRRFVLEGMRS